MKLRGKLVSISPPSLGPLYLLEGFVPESWTWWKKEKGPKCQTHIQWQEFPLPLLSKNFLRRLKKRQNVFVVFLRRGCFVSVCVWRQTIRLAVFVLVVTELVKRGKKWPQGAWLSTTYWFQHFLLHNRSNENWVEVNLSEVWGEKTFINIRSLSHHIIWIRKRTGLNHV